MTNGCCPTWTPWLGERHTRQGVTNGATPVEVTGVGVQDAWLLWPPL